MLTLYLLVSVVVPVGMLVRWHKLVRKREQELSHSGLCHVVTVIALQVTAACPEVFD